MASRSRRFALYAVAVTGCGGCSGVIRPRKFDLIGGLSPTVHYVMVHRPMRQLTASRLPSPLQNCMVQPTSSIRGTMTLSRRNLRPPWLNPSELLRQQAQLAMNRSGYHLA
ncbi:uncharacterized protein K452DRAFT_354727 [Aplosporella prunicola CBS 121167]|uniref:Uncharacterized protein n=1 Tax=Aplosporella prunicola CBS 121167 TaxID=1176127 RepID=A0A6A6BT49_9PEZI|nr:uncharacterized protein K452DRAFT_354727 [Aplosporella prunicola CBS 121167]KAF2147299.1 hypothetical protein K452DRAFT_354727 [Aplosporella prunicola CBS 121167]